MPATNQTAITTQPATFDFAALPDASRAMVEQKTVEIRDRIGRTNQNIVEIGCRLADVKGALKHGEFGDWLASEFGMSVRTAQNMMAVAARFKYATVADLNISTGALYMLASPATPETVRGEIVEQAKGGKRITRSAVAEAVKVTATRKEPEQPPITPNPERIPDEEPFGPIESKPKVATLPPPAKAAEPWLDYNASIEEIASTLRHVSDLAQQLDRASPEFTAWMDLKQWKRMFEDAAVSFETRKVLRFADKKDRLALPDGQPVVYVIDATRLRKRGA